MVVHKTASLYLSSLSIIEVKWSMTPLAATQGLIQTATGSLSKRLSNRLVWLGAGLNPVTVGNSSSFFFIKGFFINLQCPLFQCLGPNVWWYDDTIGPKFLHRQAMRIQFLGPVQSSFGNRSGPQSWEARGCDIFGWWWWWWSRVRWNKGSKCSTKFDLEELRWKVEQSERSKGDRRSYIYIIWGGPPPTNWKWWIFFVVTVSGTRLPTILYNSLSQGL